MKAVLIVLLIAIIAVCIDARRPPRELIERARRYASQSDQNNNFNFGANVNNGQWNVNGAYNRNLGNGGSLGVNGNYGSNGQWGVGGQYQNSWNNGNTNLGVNGGYQNGGGWNAGVTFTHRWDDVEEADLSLPSWVNWENAQKALEIYQQLRRDEEDDDEEADSEFIKSVWKKIGPTVRELGKNYLRSKGIPLEDEEESDQNNNFNFGANVNNGQWGVNGQYQRTWNGGNTGLGVNGAYQQGGGWNAGVTFTHRWDDAEDEEEADSEFIKSVWKKIGPTVRELGKNYLRSKGIPLSDAEFSFKKVFKKVVPVLKTVGKMYLRTQGIPLADSDSQFFKDWMKKAGSWLKNPENLQKVVDVYRTVRSDDAEDEESDFSFGGFGGYRPPRCVCVRAPCPC